MKTESGTAETTDSLCAHTFLSPKRLPGAPRILSRFSDTPRSAKSSTSPDSSWRRLLLPIRTPLFPATAFYTSHLGLVADAELGKIQLCTLRPPAVDALVTDHRRPELWAALGLGTYGPERLVTRGEVAALVDEVHDPFGLKGVDHRGRFVP